MKGLAGSRHSALPATATNGPDPIGLEGSADPLVEESSPHEILLESLSTIPLPMPTPGKDLGVQCQG